MNKVLELGNSLAFLEFLFFNKTSGVFPVPEVLEVKLRIGVVGRALEQSCSIAGKLGVFEGVWNAVACICGGCKVDEVAIRVGAYFGCSVVYFGDVSH